MQRVHQARGARTKANAADELSGSSGSPSAAGSSAASAPSPSVWSANRLAARPLLLVGVTGCAVACFYFYQ